MYKLFVFTIFSVLFSGVLHAEICQDFGPQTPRDLTQRDGKNPVKFTLSPNHKQLNLCNIHFHKHAEHKASGFSLPAGRNGVEGWQCNETPSLTSSQLGAPASNQSCKNVAPGDTVEVHWVYSSCDVKPGKGLQACSSASCANPQLRVETKVFLLVNDNEAPSFAHYTATTSQDGLHQVAQLPDRSDALEFLGSTTGPNYTEQTCSPLQVTWSVSQSCQLLDINSLHEWCEKNPFEEDHAHGIRTIVTTPQLLSPIK